MFCPKCGKETADESRFCTACGAKLEEDIGTGQDEAETGEASGKKLLLIAIAIIGVILLALSAAITFLTVNRGNRKSNDTEVMEELTDQVIEEVIESSSDTAAASDEETQEAGDAQESMQTKGTRLLVAVPTESMSVRRSPGLGDDVIAELEAGTYLEWSGESAVDNDREFYKVVIRDTQQTGYVSADYCVKVNYEYDDSVLSVVETDNTLYTYDMMVSDIEMLCSRYQNILSYNIIGTSLDGREIYEVVLGNPSAGNHIMVQATIHAREYMNTQLIMKMIEYYAYYYNTASYNEVSYSDLFGNTAFHIVPMANPDGVAISQFGTGALNNQYYADLVYECYERDKPFLAYREDSIGDMAWSDHYKEENYDREAAGDYREITFDEYTRIWKANAGGVDLNRNFDAGWEGMEVKTEPAYSDYKGAHAVSEPETIALVDMAVSRDYKAYISYHSKGQLIYYDVSGNKPETTILSENFATMLENFIKYKKINTNKGYNVNLGGFSDWIQLDLNKASVTIESGKHQCPLEAYEFKSIWLRHRESWAMLAKSLY